MLAASRSSFVTFRNFAFAFSGAIALLAACSSSDPAPPAGPAPCDSAKCAPGNQCLPLAGETKCRKTCTSNTEPAAACPFGYTCTDTLQPGVSPFCIQDTAVREDGKPIEKKPSGQWGSKCQANLGLTNPGCDSEQGFLCYGTAPSDGDAYCTRYGCAQDTDCGAGFWCATINVAPNVQKAKRTFGQVETACLRRTYCATCKADLDCPPVLGRTQHCVPDATGKEKICAPECDDTCTAQDATCKTVVEGVPKVCFPNAGACVGDKTLCSPCRADSDCGEDGVCVKGQYTTERACAKKVNACSDCPKSTPITGLKLKDDARLVGCASEGTDDIPKNHCLGLYDIGSPSDPLNPEQSQSRDIGCWTPNRKD